MRRLLPIRKVAKEDTSKKSLKDDQPWRQHAFQIFSILDNLLLTAKKGSLMAAAGLLVDPSACCRMRRGRRRRRHRDGRDRSSHRCSHLERDNHPHPERPFRTKRSPDTRNDNSRFKRKLHDQCDLSQLQFTGLRKRPGRNNPSFELPWPGKHPGLPLHQQCTQPGDQPGDHSRPDHPGGDQQPRDPDPVGLCGPAFRAPEQHHRRGGRGIMAVLDAGCTMPTGTPTPSTWTSRWSAGQPQPPQAVRSPP